MNISRFFIDRPIFASVLSVLILVGGLISVFQLPVAEYPNVVPPSVVVRAQFPGANPKVITQTVAAPLEEEINGVENMLYLSSQATSDGRMTLTVTFEIGTDPDYAQQLVQNRVSQALPRLPAVTRQLGVTTAKSSPDLTMVINLVSPNGRYDTLYLRNYVRLNIRDVLARIKGVAPVQLFGAGDYAMRLWLNPVKMAERNLTANDVVNAVREQNVQVAAGMIGGAPYADIAEIQYPINAKGRLESAEEFENIILHSNEQGQITRLKDVATVELGASEYALRSLLDNQPSVGIPINAVPGANTLEISENVRKSMEKLKQSFPEGVDYRIEYDPTVFVKSSISAVVHTLFEAVALVLLVVIIFLQNWRATIIPMLAVPVSIVGTFVFMLMFGFSINSLTLFGLVLAIGIVVDDAIIVVENVERNIALGLSAREASYKAMKEVTGPIIAVMLVLCAVFVPIAFVSGLTGQFYRQFALTIAISTVISAFNSLTLSPALARLLLKPHGESNDWLSRIIEKVFGPFFRVFNTFFTRSSDGYSKGIGKIVTRRGVGMLIYTMLIALTWFGFTEVPKGFVPSQDKQYLVSFAQLPEGSTLERSEEIVRKMTEIALNEKGVKSVIGFPGLSINGFVNSPSSGIAFVTLDDFADRESEELSASAIADRLQRQYAGIEEAFIAIFPPPPVQGLGSTGGFKLQIEDRADLGFEALQAVVDEVVQKANQQKELRGIYSSYKINVPQLYVDLDRTKAKQLGLNVEDIFTAMQVYLGSLYINDFNKFGRTYRVIAQAESEFRDNADDIYKLKIRNKKGEMIPLGAVLKVKEAFGPESSQRYNVYRSADINGNAALGFSSGQSQDAISRLLDKILPQGMAYEWTELTYQQVLAGDTTTLIIPLILLLVFLVLAAQYESLLLPLSIIMIVPLSMLSAIAGLWLTNGDNNIFTQISLFVLVGLAAKNAILIVEFANELEESGMGVIEAAVEACRLRLRPILMTSFAFIMGVWPLVVATGAGAEMRNTMGVAVFSGMLGVTFFGLFLTPVFYVLLRKIALSLQKKNS